MALAAHSPDTLRPRLSQLSVPAPAQQHAAALYADWKGLALGPCCVLGGGGMTVAPSMSWARGKPLTLF